MGPIGRTRRARGLQVDANKGDKVSARGADGVALPRPSPFSSLPAPVRVPVPYPRDPYCHCFYKPYRIPEIVPCGHNHNHPPIPVALSSLAGWSSTCPSPTVANSCRGGSSRSSRSAHLPYPLAQTHHPHTNGRARTHTLTPALTHTYTLTLTLTHSHSHTYAHTHTHTPTHTLPH